MRRNFFVYQPQLIKLEVRERSAGFIEALSSHNPGVQPKLIIKGDFMFEGGADATGTIANSGERISAVFFHNDHMVFGAIEQCKWIGIDVPNNLSVIGCNDLPTDCLKHRLAPGQSTPSHIGHLIDL